jgi:ATP-dependent helicase/nuclease subunit B
MQTIASFPKDIIVGWCRTATSYNVELSPLNMAATRREMRNEQQLLQELERNIDGAAVIARTVRAARGLRQQYQRQQQGAGNRGWRTPQILAWEPWLKTLWDAAILCGAESRILLNPAQESELWLQVLQQDEAGQQSMSVGGLATQAQQAWHAMHQYRIELRQVRNDSNIDAQSFSRWAAELEKTCQRSSLLSSSQVEVALATAARAGQLALPGKIFLVGFDRTTPSQELLIDALRGRGCAVELIEFDRIAGPEIPAVLVYARTEEDEIASAARCIRATLVEDPKLRIGIVLPSLAEMRDRIDVVFRRILAPSSMDIHASNSRLPYEFSLGTPMHRVHAIRTAMTLLRWLRTSLPADDISWLVVHGGFSSGESDARAVLDKRFRERKFQLGGAISFLSFREWLTNSVISGGGSPLRRTLERVAVAEKRQDLDRNRSYGEWRETFEELLDAAEWGLLTASNSADYQLLRRWNTLLQELSSLSAVAGPVSFADALDRLETLAANMLFTLETRNAPVQILGVSEAAGLTFDRIWWMNAQAASWPPHGHARPFLPWGVQRAAHMPYADPATDAAFAERVTKRILASAPQVIVSFALQQSDPTTASSHVPSPEIAISPVVRDALPNSPLMAVEDFLQHETPASLQPESNTDSSALERVDEEAAVPFQGQQVRSGVAFLKQQAACPFRAFAELRLAAEALQESESGLPTAAQGTLFHEVLQHFWNEMKTQKQLLQSTEEQCRQILHRHVWNELERFFQHAEEPWQNALLEVEANRVEVRLLQWLEVEKKRSDFTVLKTEDTLEHVTLGGVEFRCRMDRIDQVEQGIVLLDYKAGLVDSKACDGDRPDEPQLPAYAVLRKETAREEEALAGIAFAGLHPRNVDFTVVGSLAGIFPAAAGTGFDPRAKLSPEALQQQQEEWTTTLTQLAEDFRTGVAVVDPKKRNETCRYCEQSSLCRIREADAFVEDENSDDGDPAASSQSFQS